MLAGPSNGGLGSPGYGALVSLYQVTIAYVLHGPNAVTLDQLVALKAIHPLIDEARKEFTICDDQLMKEEMEKEKTPSNPAGGLEGVGKMSQSALPHG